MLIVDGIFNLTEASRQAELELRDAPAIARLPTNAMPPFDNVNRHKRVNELSLGFCQGRCGYNASQNFTMQEPSGCMGRRGLSLRLRHKWLACPPLEAQDCLMVSIGIGMEWDFELQLAARGCEVHAFDPTIGLHAAHRKTADGLRRTFPRLHFHFLGLGDSRVGSRAAAAYSRAAASNDGGVATDETGSSLGPVQQLDELLRGVGALGRSINVLKIDCEGCEWHAFRYLSQHRPHVLCRVTQLNLELHLFQSELRNGSDLPTLLEHAWVDHGFRVFRAVVNSGWFVPFNRSKKERLPPELGRWGFDGANCCYHLQMLRTSGAGRRCVGRQS